MAPRPQLAGPEFYSPSKEKAKPRRRREHGAPHAVESSGGRSLVVDAQVAGGAVDANPWQTRRRQTTELRRAIGSGQWGREAKDALLAMKGGMNRPSGGRVRNLARALGMRPQTVASILRREHRRCAIPVTHAEVVRSPPLDGECLRKAAMTTRRGAT